MAKQIILNEESTFLSRNRDVIVFILILVCSLAVIIIFNEAYLGTFAPLNVFQQGLVNFSEAIKNSGLWHDRIEELETQYSELVSALNMYEYATQLSQQQQRTIRQLNEALDFSSTLRYNNIIALIIARDPNQAFHVFTINKGASHGIGIDMPVIAIHEGRIGLLGRVLRVAERSSVVQSIIDEESYVIAEHIETELAGIINGSSMNNQVLTLDFIDSRGIENVRAGDMIVSSRFSSVYPPSIPIGTVLPFQQERDADSITIDIMPILNFNRLNQVFVLIPDEIFVN